MINPLIKNCRTGFHDDILNRTSHYMRLLQSKSTIDNQLDKIYRHRSHIGAIKTEQQQKEEDNIRLYKKLMSIERKPQYLMTESIESNNEQKRTLKCYYKQRQKTLGISQDNIRLVKKLKEIESDLSEKKFPVGKKKKQKIPQKNNTELHKIQQIDNLYYKSYRNQLLRERMQSNIDKISWKRVKNHQKKQKRYRYQTFKEEKQAETPQKQ